ncbi:hypothetical protein IMSAGC019_03103 [Lachnospiraceae bacterium]|nr:hypothetical protein IMSAGC019_03103 [Lachnospiraceae bacterium]
MTLKEYREKINPCYGYECYNEDLGCTMSGIDRTYACPLITDDEMEYTDGN